MTEDQDSAARLHLFASVAFAVAAGVLLVALFLSLRFPDAVGQLPQLTYGRLKPMMLTTAVLGWLTLAGIGAVYYLLPRLTGTPMWGERIARLNLMAAIPIYAAASLSPMFGLSSGQDLLEVPWYLDLLVLATLAVPLGVTVQTLRRRTEEGIYVSLWYVVAGVFAAFGLWLVGNIPGVIGDLPGLGGMTTALQRVMFSSGFLTLWVVGIGIGTAYYLLPKETGNPLFSRGLAAAGFWSVVLAALWAAPSALTHTPIPGWTQTVAAVMALGLVIPALAVATNFAGTLHGRWDTFTNSLPVRFAVAATSFLVLVTLASAGRGFPSVSTVVGFTPTADAVLIVTVFGVAGLFSAAFTYHAIPRIAGRQVFSTFSGRLHLRMAALGSAALGILLWVTGTVTGYTWVGAARTGAFVAAGEGWAEVEGSTLVFTSLLPLAALLVAVGLAAFGYNVLRSYTSGETVPQEVLVASGTEDG